MRAGDACGTFLSGAVVKWLQVGPRAHVSEETHAPHARTRSHTRCQAKPFVLLLGQYSVGKTSFINHLLGNPPNGYPGSNVGPEPTTDRFQAIMYGRDERVLPGNAVAVSPGKPFKGLQIFGNAFLQKFQCSECRAQILESMTLIDTPGVLSGEKQRIGRNYDMAEVCKWFAERSDLILVLFDAHKLDISDELKVVIENLRGNDDKIRIVLNKADQVTPQQLMRVYGALMWSLGKVFRTPEVTRVYISSFWDRPYKDIGQAGADLYDKEKKDLFRDLRDIPKNAAVRRVNELVKRARTSKVHALVCACLRKMMPAMFGKDKKQKELIKNLDIIFQAVAQEHGISQGDFPATELYRERLVRWTGTGRTLANLPKHNRDLIKKLDDCLSNEIPTLLRPLAVEHGGLAEQGRPKHSQAAAFSPAFQVGGGSSGVSDEEMANTLAMVRAALGGEDEDDAGSRPPTAPAARPAPPPAATGLATGGGGYGGGGGGAKGAGAGAGTAGGDMMSFDGAFDVLHPMRAEQAPPPNKTLPAMPPAKVPPPPPTAKAKMCRVLYEYTASSDGELTIRKVFFTSLAVCVAASVHTHNITHVLLTDNNRCQKITQTGAPCACACAYRETKYIGRRNVHIGRRNSDHGGGRFGMVEGRVERH